MVDDADKSGRKQRGRPFVKGQSGNPAGVPLGSRHKATKLLDAIGEEVRKTCWTPLYRPRAGVT